MKKKGVFSQQYPYLAGLGFLYLIWGTPFLARRIAIETMPPLISEGLRFTLAGMILFPFARLWTREAPSLRHWKAAAVTGAFLILGGNGGVVWSQQYVPSGIAALFIGMVPLWMVIVDWVWNRKNKPGVRTILGIVVGFAGVALLALPGGKTFQGLPLLPSLFLLNAAFCWAFGSIYARRAELPVSRILFAGMQMLCGGVILLGAATLRGEWQVFSPARVSPLSWAALGYVILVASIAGFSIYNWLLHHLPPAVVTTYAYVNPVVALFLGWKFAGEPLTPRVLTAALVILTAVAVIVSATRPPAGSPREPLEVP